MPIAWSLSPRAVAETVARFPVAALLAVVVAAGMLGVAWPTWLVGVPTWDYSRELAGFFLDASPFAAYDGRLLLLLIMGLPVALALEVLSERIGRGRPVAWAAALVVLAALALWTFRGEPQPERLVPLVFGIWLLPFAVGPNRPLKNSLALRAWA